MSLSEASLGGKPKKKQGRPKGSKKKAKVKAPKEEPKIESISQAVSASESAWTAAEAAAAAEAVAKAAAEKAVAARSAAEAAAEKEYEAAAAEAVATEAGESFTNRYKQDQIFRREMGEPEFWLDKNNRFPTMPILSQDEEKEVSRDVQIPTNQIPPYKPENILSPEFGGISNYELAIKAQREKIEQKLVRLRSDPNAIVQEIYQAEEDIKTLDYLFENFYIGMNVFRTAKGGRDKLRG